MADTRLKRMFQEAAEIAEGMPEALRETAFNRALDLLMGKDAPGMEAGGEAAGQRRILGIPGSGAVLEKSVAALNLATARLGLEAMSAEQIADTIEERFGVHVSEGVVARVLEGADNVVAKVRSGGETLYRIIRPVDVQDMEDDLEPPAGKKPPAKPKAKAGAAKGSTAKSKARGTGARAGVKKKSARKP